MVQNKETEEKVLTNGDIKKETTPEPMNGDASDYEESDDDDYLDHLLMLPPLNTDPTTRNKDLVSKTLFDFITAIENRKEYQKIRQELLLDCAPTEEKDEKEDAVKVEEIVEVMVNGKESPEPEVETNELIEVNVEEVPELGRRQSIRLKKAQFGELNSLIIKSWL